MLKNDKELERIKTILEKIEAIDEILKIKTSITKAL